jgi:hypothetical protein
MLAWHVLQEWRQLPGSDGSGWDADTEQLQKWVTSARAILAENDRSEIGDEMIGQVLSTGAHGAPDGWPTAAVREVLEVSGTPAMESGFYVGTLNSRGITSRDPYDGGAPERELASRYRVLAEGCRGWRRVSRLLGDIATSYERDARRQDGQARWLGDEG